ncbi:replication-relaxation family protein (plasmid) [Listeria seeligeri]|uniref:replication-relaxation family protein n=2 Tax=Listeria seeligeri TaxID=1640 RepID=UPI0018890900|nr:replication-relaxation family protein [Listeria seeligeri]QPJ28004.1 replication-relaxation family protein [Listeria seeligeri]
MRKVNGIAGANLKLFTRIQNRKEVARFMSLEKLTNHYYIDPTSNNANYIRILTLVNELRIITKKQIRDFIAFENGLTKNTYDKILSFLVDHYYIERIEDYRYKKSVIYYITKEGVQFLGSPYTVPNNPYYNIEHHLKINDMLIEAFQVVGRNPYLNSVSSERRLVFEAKDAKEANGRIYKVPDFDFEFLSPKDGIDIIWHFEIELTLKSFTRYSKRIIPHYLNMLDNEYTAQDKIIYVVPTSSIQNKLQTILRSFEESRNKTYTHFIIGQKSIK